MWLFGRAADINTIETTITGNMHGMPLAFLTGATKYEHVTALSWLKPCLSTSNLSYVGLRDVDKDEKRVIKKNNILAFSMREVDRYGIGDVMDRLLQHIDPASEHPIH